MNDTSLPFGHLVLGLEEIIEHFQNIVGILSNLMALSKV